MMRVIAGSARSLKLKTIEGEGTRPTTDRIKETLFNMLSVDIERSRFLDLFSGSGAIGIEALSRGAKEAVFVENNKKAAECIKDNLKHTKLFDKGRLMQKHVLTALEMLEREGEPFDYIFMDPPYNQLLEKQVLEFLEDSKLVDEYTMIIVEASQDTDFSYLDDMDYVLTKEKKYKTNKHMFIRKR